MIRIIKTSSAWRFVFIITNNNNNNNNVPIWGKELIFFIMPIVARIIYLPWQINEVEVRIIGGIWLMGEHRRYGEKKVSQRDFVRRGLACDWTRSSEGKSMVLRDMKAKTITSVFLGRGALVFNCLLDGFLLQSQFKTKFIVPESSVEKSNYVSNYNFPRYVYQGLFQLVGRLQISLSSAAVHISWLFCCFRFKVYSLFKCTKLLEMTENYHSLEYSILTVDSAAFVRIAL